MKQSLFFLILITAFFNAGAQADQLKIYKPLNDSVIACFNRNDFKAIYALGTDSFKTLNPETAFVNRFQSIKREFGEVTSTKFIARHKAVQLFKWKEKPKI